MRRMRRRRAVRSTSRVRGTDNLGQLAGGQAAESVHLPEAILRGDVALEEKRVLPASGGDVRDAERVANDGGSLGHWRGEGSRNLGQRAVGDPDTRQR